MSKIFSGLIVLSLAVFAGAACDAITGPDDDGEVEVLGLHYESFDEQNGLRGRAIGAAPSVRVRNGAYEPVGGQSVEFRVTAGGGHFGDGSTVMTVQGEDWGIAAVPEWVLGREAGENVVVARLAEGDSLVFTAEGVRGYWVADHSIGGGLQGVSAISMDGVSWEVYENPMYFAHAFAGNGEILLAGGAQNGLPGPTLALSEDGRTWEAIDNPADEVVRSLTWAGGLWVLTGHDRSGEAILATSEDGRTWTARDYPPPHSVNITRRGVRDVAGAPDGSLWVAVGYNPAIRRSTDLNSWANRENSEDLYRLAWTVETNGETWVVGGRDDEAIRTSSDGVSWTTRNVPLDFVAELAWAGDQWVAVGVTPGGSWEAATSPDGIEWTLRNVPWGSFDWPARSETVAWNGDRMIALRGHETAWSEDGVEWTVETNNIDEAHTALTWWEPDLPDL